jgi:hypothetical protein
MKTRLTSCRRTFAVLVLLLALVMILAIAANTVYAQAQAPTIALLSPAIEEVVTSDTTTITIAAAGYTLSCPLLGKASVPGVGHWHIHLDGQLLDMECTTQHTMSLVRVAPGWHTLEVVLATDGHVELSNPGASQNIKFYYKPPLPRISIRVPAPTAEVPVGTKFRVELKVTNFSTPCEPAEPAFGQSLIPSEGHWHLYIDGLDQAHMVDMGCRSYDVLYSGGLSRGPHKLYARLVDNHHMPLPMDPLYPQIGDTYYPDGYPDIVSAPVTFVVK